MIYFLQSLKTRPTGRVIAKSLGFRHWGTRRLYKGQAVDLVLRWGASDPVNAAIEIQPAAAIRRAANKWTTLTTLRNAGVSVPRFSEDPEILQEDGFTRIYGRMKYGSQGRNMRIFENETPYGFQFYTGGIDVGREYRLHVIGDEVIRVQGKYLDHPEQNTCGGRIHNYANGYRFRTPRQRLRPQREQDAVAAVKALGLDFGAVDLIVDTEGNHYVLEVNTGPSCSPMTANGYAQRLAALIAKRTSGAYRPEVNARAFDALVEEDLQPMWGGV
jgi:predicted ATP-grasp superfamily ATP-dependent carboligase